MHATVTMVVNSGRWARGSGSDFGRILVRSAIINLVRICGMKFDIL